MTLVLGKWNCPRKLTLTWSAHVQTRKYLWSWVWWHTPLVTEVRRQTKDSLREFEACLIFRVSSATAKATQRNTVPNKTKQKDTSQKWDQDNLLYQGREGWLGRWLSWMGTWARISGIHVKESGDVVYVCHPSARKAETGGSWCSLDTQSSLIIPGQWDILPKKKKKKWCWAWWLRALAVIPEVLSSIPSNHLMLTIIWMGNVAHFCPRGIHENRVLIYILNKTKGAGNWGTQPILISGLHIRVHTTHPKTST